MGSSTTRFGVIGTGGIASAMTTDVAQLPDVSVVAVGSRTAASAQRFAEAHDVARAYGSYAELVADPEGTLKDLLGFLGEEWDPTLLDFAKGKHDVPERYHRQLAARQAAAGDAGTDKSVYASRVGTYRTELDPLVRSLFWVTSRSTLKELGY